MGLQIQGAISPDLTDLEQRVQAAHDLAEKAEGTGQNARDMVLRRDPQLMALDERYDTLQELASSYAQALPASVADRQALHAELAAVQTAVAAEVQARTQAVSSEATTRKAADDALAARSSTLEAAVAALQKLNVIVGFGVANLPASLAAGATTNVTVPLSKDMGSTTYSVGYGLAGGVSLLGNLQISGVVGQTKTNVTVAVKNAGLSALLNLSTASVSVVAAREG